MKCRNPECGCNTYITDSRAINISITRRRHKCKKCGESFTTYELYVADAIQLKRVHDTHTAEIISRINEQYKTEVGQVNVAKIEQAIALLAGLIV